MILTANVPSNSIPVKDTWSANRSSPHLTATMALAAAMMNATTTGRNNSGIFRPLSHLCLPLANGKPIAMILSSGTNT